ncbi:MAG: hypothetical protein Q7V88_08080 [Actinomycetota bacterium]|nr:hypothetical protein [Actinomycetota bacterium]
MIIAVGSWRGTGASTTALLAAHCLALSDAAGAWLLEADPAGGVLAGRVRLPAAAVGGLERVAFPTERGSAADAFAAVAHTAGSLRVVSAPADPFRSYACHQPRLPWVQSLRDLPGSLVVDVGTLRGGTPVWPILVLADVVLLVCSPEVSAAVAGSEWMHAAGRVSPTDPGLLDAKARLVFVDSPGGVAFPRATLLGELGDTCAGWLPWEPATVDLVHRGATANDRRLRRSALMAAVNQMVLAITPPTGTPPTGTVATGTLATGTVPTGTHSNGGGR